MSKPSEWGKPPFRYECVGDSDGEQYGYDHMVYDADGEELANAPNERVGQLFGASADLLAACEAVAEFDNCEEAADWKDAANRLIRQCVAAVRKAKGESS
jgi:hypothetical protein